MNVYLTFDVEVWCGGWDALDANFPASFERYVYGRSDHGDYALPATLEIMARHGIKGIFFVEPLFSARFGAKYLSIVVDMIQQAGHSVQMHLHPEWTDEITPAPIPGTSAKRQHLIHYTEEEQAALIAFGKRLLIEAGADAITTFRAGSFAADRATYAALASADLCVDSSLNECYAVSGIGLESFGAWAGAQRHRVGKVVSYPVSVFRDGLGNLRPAHLTACSLAELKAAIDGAESGGYEEFVLVSHNFEMLKPGSSEPDRWMVRRFDGLCRYLRSRSSTLDVGAPMQGRTALGPAPSGRASVPIHATARRFAEQALRRFI